MKIITYCLIIVFCFCSGAITAQTPAGGPEINETPKFLKNLTRATPEEVDAAGGIKLNDIPIYRENGQRLKGDEIIEVITGGNYQPIFYINEKKQIKAVVLREATEEEKARMKNRSAGSRGRGEHSRLIGTEPPAFAVTDLTGNNYSLAELKGKIIVINFWFIECKPCLVEIPELNRLVEKHKDREKVVFLAFATNSKSELARFLANRSFTYNIIPDSVDFIEEFGINAYPTHIIVDEDLKITYAKSGYSRSAVDSVEEEIRRLLDKKS